MSKKVSKFSFRATFACPLFGSPKDFGNKLPTYADVWRFCCLTRANLVPLEGNKEPNFSDIALAVVAKIESMYKKSSIPAISLKGIVQKVVRFHTRYRDFMKPYKSRKENSS